MSVGSSRPCTPSARIKSCAVELPRCGPDTTGDLQGVALAYCHRKFIVPARRVCVAGILALLLDLLGRRLPLFVVGTPLQECQDRGSQAP